jgi:ABC-type Fe3+-hydroxamate transport system substrate-binding protein
LLSHLFKYIELCLMSFNMEGMMLKKMPKVVVALGGALILAACAGGVQKDLSAEAIVRDRASERWKLLVEGRLEFAYNYL